MQLTTSQLQTLKAWVIANAGSVYDQAAANALNAAASPDYWMWRTAVEKKEIVEKVSQVATSFAWAGNGFISRSAGELECWNQLFNSILKCNPSLPNVRQAFADIFSGTGNAAANRTHLLAVSRRKATAGEKLFAVVATGPGNDGGTRGTTTNPDNFGPAKNGTFAEGPITLQDVIDSASA